MVSCFTCTSKVFSDQTGQLPVPSTVGNKYMFILLDYNSNYITAVPIPSRTKFQLLQVYKDATKILEQRGFKPKLQFLDNKASTLLK